MLEKVTPSKDPSNETDPTGVVPDHTACTAIIVQSLMSTKEDEILALNVVSITFELRVKIG
jgi:hypothetical protein